MRKKPVCPVTAIYAEDDVPEDMKEYIDLDAQWFKEAEPVRARIRELKPA